MAATPPSWCQRNAPSSVISGFYGVGGCSSAAPSHSRKWKGTELFRMRGPGSGISYKSKGLSDVDAFSCIAPTSVAPSGVTAFFTVDSRSRKRGHRRGEAGAGRYGAQSSAAPSCARDAFLDNPKPPPRRAYHLLTRRPGAELDKAPPPPKGAKALPRNMAELTQKSRSRNVGKKSKFGCWGEGPPGAKAKAPAKSKELEKPSKIFEACLNPGTEFRKLYERGDLPVQVEHGARKSLRWKVDKTTLDYMVYLPIFFDGLREKVDPYAFLADHGTRELLRDGGAKILPVVPQLVLPVKHALDTKDPDTMCRTLKALQDLVQSAEMVGAALVPYYRQMLPVLNLFINRNCNIGDAIEYGQMKRENLGDLIAETLALMEQYGGEDAYINIKYMIPTYESYVEAA